MGEDSTLTGNEAKWNAPARTNTFVQRVTPRRVKLLDKVYFDAETDHPGIAMVVKIYNDTVALSCHNREETRSIFKVYPVDEMLSHGHWDYLDEAARANELAGAGFGNQFIKQDWHYLPNNVQKIIREKTGAKPDPRHTQGTENDKFTKSTSASDPPRTTNNDAINADQTTIHALNRDQSVPNKKKRDMRTPSDEIPKAVESDSYVDRGGKDDI